MNKELKIGLLAVVAIIALVFGVNYLKGINILNDNRNFYAVYENIGGLQVGSPVMVNGYKVGMVSNIDLLLDDGGHTYEQQIITTELLLETINDGGLLVIEDTHSSYMKNYGPRKYSFIEYTKNKIDAINMRFKDISEQKCERRFWSIEFVESMVAFRINKKASYLKSELISNNGENDYAEDFVYRNANISHKMNSFFKKMNISTENKIVKRIIKKCEKIFTKRKFSSRKYFD